MRRFIADAILIIVLVAIGNYITNDDSQKDRSEVEKNIAEFEDEIANHQNVTPKSEPVHLNEIDENTAAKLARGASDFIVDIADGSAVILSQLFSGLTD